MKTCIVLVLLLIKTINPLCWVHHNAMLLFAVSYLKSDYLCRLAVDLLRLVVISVK